MTERKNSGEVAAPARWGGRWGAAGWCRGRHGVPGEGSAGSLGAGETPVELGEAGKWRVMARWLRAGRGRGEGENETRGVGALL